MNMSERIDGGAGRQQRFGAFQRYPRNAWYVAAGRCEISSTPMSRQLLDEPVALFRTEAGTVVAMRDACPHRGFPLSQGTVVGDSLQCRYHGIVFNQQGRCVRIPTQPGAAAPDALCAKVYPTVEKWHWVWIWIGDPDKADASLIPSYECEDYAHYDHRFYSPVGPFLGNFQLIHDNLCDASHTSFLHAGLLDDAKDAQMALAEPQVKKMGERTFRVWRDMMDFVPNKEVAGLYHLEAGKRYNRRLEVWHHFPNSMTAFNRYYEYTETFDLEHTGKLMVEHITALGITPASHNTSYHLTAVSSSFEQTDMDKEGLLYIIGQDIEAFGHIQRYFEANAETAVEVSIPYDRLGIMSRRIIAEMVRQEALEAGSHAVA